MRERRHDGLRLSEIGVGCYALSGAYGTKDPKVFARMLVRAHELGVRVFDTADAYGDAERILGEALCPIRDEVLLATKVGPTAGVRPSLRREAVKAACDRSLARLKTDRIDLYQVHFDDPPPPVRETVDALEELVEEGKIRRYGLGHLPLARVQDYAKAGRLFSVLLELSAVAREAEQALLPFCRAHGIGVIAFSPTGRGLLTGTIPPVPSFEPDDIRSIDPLFRRERLASGQRVAARLAEVGKRLGKTPAQVAIAWVLSRPGVVCTLVGPSTIAHLEEDVGGGGWDLPPEDVAGLDALLATEDAWVRERQEASVREILHEPLPDDSARALEDLVYVLETSILLDLIPEAEAIPFAEVLLPLRRSPGPEALPALRRAYEDLRARLHVSGSH